MLSTEYEAINGRSFESSQEEIHTSTEPRKSEKPFTIAGFMVYFAMYLLMRKLSLSLVESESPDPGNPPLWTFILFAVCHVRIIT